MSLEHELEDTMKDGIAKGVKKGICESVDCLLEDGKIEEIASRMQDALRVEEIASRAIEAIAPQLAVILAVGLEVGMKRVITEKLDPRIDEIEQLVTNVIMTNKNDHDKLMVFLNKMYHNGDISKDVYNKYSSYVSTIETTVRDCE